MKILNQIKNILIIVITILVVGFTIYFFFSDNSLYQKNVDVQIEKIEMGKQKNIEFKKELENKKDEINNIDSSICDPSDWLCGYQRLNAAGSR